tara:strand:+ start:1509 stop:1904 length:396 start_codon:yes stop_codon:yes gene_type:complete
MAIKITHKSTRPNNSTSWYNRDGNEWKGHSAFNAISKSIDSSNPSTFVERTHPDDLTMICTFSWPDLSTYNAAVGDYDASSNSAWKSYADAKGTYEEENNITTIRYIYDASDNLTSTQKRVRKVYWEDYSE